MASTKRRRWIELLRRPSTPTESAGQHHLEDAALFDAHERGGRALESLKTGAETVTAGLARNRSEIESLTERSQLLRDRTDALVELGAKANEGVERIRVVGLNAGLEGARLPEPHGGALTLLAEELRQHVQRASEVTQDILQGISSLRMSASELHAQADSLRSEVATVGQDASSLRAEADEGRKAWSEVGSRLQNATGMDVSVAKTLNEASDHAKGLATALSRLSSTKSSLVRDALRPALAPLKRLLGDVLGHDDDAASPPSTD